MHKSISAWKAALCLPRFFNDTVARVGRHQSVTAEVLTKGTFLLVVKGPAADATDEPCGTLWWRRLVFSFFRIMEHRWNEFDRGNRSTRVKTCPNATLSTKNFTWTEPGSNSDLRGGRPAANRLSHGTANRYLLGECFSKVKAYTRLWWTPPSDFSVGLCMWSASVCCMFTSSSVG
jgi:hypothetical protein